MNRAIHSAVVDLKFAQSRAIIKESAKRKRSRRAKLGGGLQLAGAGGASARLPRICWPADWLRDHKRRGALLRRPRWQTSEQQVAPPIRLCVPSRRNSSRRMRKSRPPGSGPNLLFRNSCAQKGTRPIDGSVWQATEIERERGGVSHWRGLWAGDLAVTRTRRVVATLCRLASKTPPAAWRTSGAGLREHSRSCKLCSCALGVKRAGRASWPICARSLNARVAM